MPVLQKVQFKVHPTWLEIQIVPRLPCGIKTVSIFLSPPNLHELRKRLELRSTETDQEINKRLSRFEEEDNLKKEFDYNLINDNFETTFENIKEISNKDEKNIHKDTLESEEFYILVKNKIESTSAILNISN